MDLSVSEKLCYSTTRLEVKERDGRVTLATGFFVKFNLDKSGNRTFLVTNRHVVEEAVEMMVHFNASDEQGKPILGKKVDVIVKDVPKISILHPDPSIDLAVVSTEKMLEDAKAKVGKVGLLAFTEKGFMSVCQADFDAFEEVIMVGYPKGLWDEANNRPLFRKGITATDPKIDYNGKKIFLIDCGSIYGSSGSPVFIYNKGIHVDKFGQKITLGESSISLLGIFAGLHYHREKIEVEKDGKLTEAEVKIPINIGYVMKAENLLDIKKILEEQHD